MKKELRDDERRALLWREVVYQAVRDMTLTGEAGERARRSAHKFVFDKDDGCGSFSWACKQAGLDVEKVRDEVRARCQL